MKLLSSPGLTRRVLPAMAALAMALTRLQADVLDAAAEVQRGIESAIVELYGGEVTPETWTSTRQVVQGFSSNLESDAAKKTLGGGHASGGGSRHHGGRPSAGAEAGTASACVRTGDAGPPAEGATGARPRVARTDPAAEIC
ncbi:hypothetical protein [Verrucomicrobium sp. BvORR034]|uniref:hypothetical protein n=1 Tax=Verrucomicrobium sp. BvORR034 TaxID=1396418 RepID=UPI000A70556D|nr:hypothetical protein [Verrucomicrobium sp. BvORR034]